MPISSEIHEFVEKQWAVIETARQDIVNDMEACGHDDIDTFLDDHDIDLGARLDVSNDRGWIAGRIFLLRELEELLEESR